MIFADVKEWRIPEGEVTKVVDSQNRIIWEKETIDYTEPFYVENTGVSTKQVEIGATLGDMTIYTSTNKTTWTPRTISQYNSIYINISINSKLYIEYDSTLFSTWPGKIYYSDKIGGNFMSLIYGRQFDGTQKTFPLNNTRLSSVFQSTNITDAGDLILPATTLTEYCYQYMFAYCTSLTKAPALPATALAQNCYAYMFRDCTSLATAPALPATTLTEYCYLSMFYNCTALTKAPELPATELVRSCYNNMFDDCTSLNEIKCLATSGININSSTGYWLRNVSSTGTFYKATGVTWSTGTSGIPSGWTVVEV